MAKKQIWDEQWVITDRPNKDDKDLVFISPYNPETGEITIGLALLLNLSLNNGKYKIIGEVDLNEHYKRNNESIS